MSEPIILFDEDGKELTVYGKAQAAALIKAGTATAEKPAKVKTVDAAEVAEEAAEATATKPAAKSKKTGKL